jgi:phosphoribosylformylglycinamidine (FGAM) synthase-like amidotransferase family enzyme
MMEEGEEEQADPDDVFAQYCDFAMKEGEEEADAENSIYNISGVTSRSTPRLKAKGS